MLAQRPKSRFRLFERLNTHLKSTNLERLRIAVAYARWDGIGLISPQIESFLDRGGEFQSIYGIGNGVTTPDGLLYSLYLQEMYSGHTYAGAVEDKYINATFHPKLFEFRFSDNTVAIIGSGNLTGAGMSRNTEIGAELTIKHGSPLEAQLEETWKALSLEGRKVTLSLIRRAKREQELGSEHHLAETRSKKKGKPRLKIGVKASPKPLFSKVLDLKQASKKGKILASLDALTNQPKTLYLQILKYETGAQSAEGIGYQIQLPVATLGAFFGLGVKEQKRVTLHFPEEVITVALTHFKNKTHRIRLRPLRNVRRPAIVVFRRMGSDEYQCAVVREREYSRVLIEKCTQQTRTGARKWGLE